VVQVKICSESVGSLRPDLVRIVRELCFRVHRFFPRFEATVSAWWFGVSMVVFELALGLWLLIRGLRASRLVGPDVDGNQARADVA
jgi:hypothetical protein